MIESDNQQIHVLDSAIPYSAYVPIDLSAKNPALHKVRLDDPEDFGHYISKHLENSNALACYGGYNELRNLYRSSAIFGDSDIDQRDIHIGIDLWASAGTAVISAQNGIVHSFANNLGKGNYGPTIILQHQSENQHFYTLYGHLSLASLTGLTIGRIVKRGEIIGNLGEASVNGNYPPHLHFQLIREIGNYSGDYPGVCSFATRDYYLQNCPDPNLLLKIN